jgi:hypothetical protein
VAQQLTGAPSAAVDELRAERDQNHASLNDIFIVFQEVLPMDPHGTPVIRSPCGSLAP